MIRLLSSALCLSLAYTLHFAAVAVFPAVLSALGLLLLFSILFGDDGMAWRD